jgi:hypothetical protein
MRSALNIPESAKKKQVSSREHEKRTEREGRRGRRRISLNRAGNPAAGSVEARAGRAVTVPSFFDQNRKILLEFLTLSVYNSRLYQITPAGALIEARFSQNPLLRPGLCGYL